MAPFNQISSAQLMRQIGLPDAPAIVDVRTAEDIDADPYLIPTSQTISHRALIPANFADQRVVVACHRGLKLSEGVAAMLRSHGIAAEVLEGGNLGWAAAGLPRIPLAAMPQTHLWVTRHRPKIDRVACPWLIRRFVDPNARFLFVSPSEVAEVASRFDATPFDIEEVPFSHRGENCTFDAMVADFGLSHPALERLALVVRAADTGRHDLSPQAAGLLAISVGLSRQYRDDHQQLAVGMTFYDALYRWARDGQDEGHDWPAGRGQ